MDEIREGITNFRMVVYIGIRTPSGVYCGYLLCKMCIHLMERFTMWDSNVANNKG